jgi:hypothetical protein
MREFEIKLVALKESFYIANNTKIPAPNYSTLVNVRTQDLLTNGSILSNRVLNVVQYRLRDEKFDKIVTSACAALVQTTKRSEYICYFVMTTYYNRLVTFLKQSNTILLETKMSDYKIVKHLVDLDVHTINQLKKMNRYFRLFYYLLVHELALLVDEECIQYFNHLLKSLGDFEEYNNLFTSCKQLADIASIYLLPDVVNIIYSYGCFDKEIALNKNISLLKYDLDKNETERKDQIQKKQRNKKIGAILILTSVLLFLSFIFFGIIYL